MCVFILLLEQKERKKANKAGKKQAHRRRRRRRRRSFFGGIPLPEANFSTWEKKVTVVYSRAEIFYPIKKEQF